MAVLRKSFQRLTLPNRGSNTAGTTTLSAEHPGGGTVPRRPPRGILRMGSHHMRPLTVLALSIGCLLADSSQPLLLQKNY